MAGWHAGRADRLGGWLAGANKDDGGENCAAGAEEASARNESHRRREK